MWRVGHGGRKELRGNSKGLKPSFTEDSPVTRKINNKAKKGKGKSIKHKKSYISCFQIQSPTSLFNNLLALGCSAHLWAEPNLNQYLQTKSHSLGGVVCGGGCGVWGIKFLLVLSVEVKASINSMDKD